MPEKGAQSSPTDNNPYITAFGSHLVQFSPLQAIPKDQSFGGQLLAQLSGFIQSQRTKGLLQHQSHLLSSHAGALPIIQVILQVPITNAKLQLLQECFVLH